jgi:hypothetical protein
MADDDIDTKLDEQFNRFGATLFKYLDKRFAEVDSRIDDLKGQGPTLKALSITSLANLTPGLPNEQPSWLSSLATTAGIVRPPRSLV